MSEAREEPGPLYPYEVAIANLILLLLAVGAIFDSKDTSIGYRILVIVVLTGMAALLAKRTEAAGYTPTRVRTNRLLERQRNVAGWMTVVLVIADIIVAPLMLLS